MSNQSSGEVVICPDCGGDGKETCHNPDHGLISALSFHDIGRLGCPCCGHNERHKVSKGGACYTCGGSGQATEQIARDFCEGLDYDFDEVMTVVSRIAKATGESK